MPKDLKKAVTDTPAIAKTTIPERPASKGAVTKEEEEEKVVDVVADEPEVHEESEAEVEPVTEKASEKTEAELKAEKITDAQIKSYWKAIEKVRKAPRVHQEDLDLGEKVLRYFDVSSQYGVSLRHSSLIWRCRNVWDWICVNISFLKPCIGITRVKRWQRAERLGMKPPIEVLAVLLKEENKENDEVETAHMDRIMNATALST